MRDVLILLVHVIVTAAHLMRQGGVRSVAADSALLRLQLLVPMQPRQRAPDVRTFERIVAGVCEGFMHRARPQVLAVA